ncbi:unnamed protein product [Cuscuta europaea]|uniref:Putative GTP diphosphokinase RSH1, chloroplastic n=2 Tax=Cuscuta europaea TaxID=41803 RepID=A0A9P0YXN6_CUSEU|nr:unnamed protein product [Cuscuta europaea]
MTSVSSMSVPVECFNMHSLWNGDGSGRFNCGVLSCAWKARRALTGFLTSTPNPPQLSLGSYGQTGRRNSIGCICNVPEIGRCNPGKDFSSKWKLCSSLSFSSKPSEEISPDSLWKDLQLTISYLSTKELEWVRSALNLAFEAHDGQKRRSGEPFIIHPVAVAQILGELELDWESIAAGLLHDTVEDTNVVTFERIEREFGITVRRIVEGETKVSKLGKIKYKDQNHPAQDVKADDLRQMFLSMTEEVRIIIVKLADRLHNMRTLSHMPPHKQSNIAEETLQVFAPLAKLLGMYQIKSELENLAFMYTNAQDFAKIQRRIAELDKEHEKELLEAKRILTKKIEDDQFLDLMTISTEVRSLCKQPYSIYKGVIKSKSSINEVNQTAQIRIIIKQKSCAGVGPLCNAQQICYHVLGLVHGIWTPIPRAMKDYIATPKPNGYQSLHTTVIPFLYESMLRLEVQIRTDEMDLIAERGIAAHYSGKALNGLIAHAVHNGSSHAKTACLNNANVALRIGWLNAIREWQEEFVGNITSREFVDTIKRDLLGSRVFVFTPRGEIKNLPEGATVIDCAYMIHTEIGNKMVAAKVNGNIVSPVHVLANAEVVEIITYSGLSNKSAFRRHKHWLQHAKTHSARHKIMKFLREQAALSASEITAESVIQFAAECGDNSGREAIYSSRETKFTPEKILKDVVKMPFAIMNGEGDPFDCSSGIQTPKVNGKLSKHLHHVSLKGKGETLSQGNGVGRVIQANILMYQEVYPGLDGWLASKVTSWNNLEGHSIQWFCVVCMDRKGMMADVTSTLAAVHVSICSCVTEVNREKGMAVMLFHVAASMDDLVAACTRVDAVLGVLGWYTGCSWPGYKQFLLEC